MDKFEIKNTLYKRNLKSRPLSILLYLIDRANEDLVCFPSIKTISSDLNISVSTTKRALKSLVEIGYIEKIERFLDTTGKQTSNLYVIKVENIKEEHKIEEVNKPKEEKNNINKIKEENNIEIKKEENNYLKTNINFNILEIVKFIFENIRELKKNSMLKFIKKIKQMMYVFKDLNFIKNELERGSFLLYL